MLMPPSEWMRSTTPPCLTTMLYTDVQSVICTRTLHTTYAHDRRLALTLTLPLGKTVRPGRLANCHPPCPSPTHLRSPFCPFPTPYNTLLDGAQAFLDLFVNLPLGG